MQKVLFVANTDWYLFNFRLSLARYLQSQGYDVVLVSPRGEFVPELTRQGFRWIEWNVDRKGINLLQEIGAVIQLLKIYRAEKPSVVHHFTIKPVLYGMLASRLARVQASVNSITGLGFLFLQKGKAAEVRRKIVTLIYRWALSGNKTAVIFENTSDQDYFLNHKMVSSEKTYVIEGVGVDVERFVPAPEPDGDPVVIMPARLLWDKGVGTLVDAARILRERLTVRIALVGQPDPGNPASVDPVEIQQWVSDGIVEWWGFQREMANVYHACHIVTLPSFGEGLPTALIEAGACGRPVVTTDVPGCRDVVVQGISGLIIPPDDPSALADALEQLLLDKQLRLEMGSAGRRIILEHFTTARVNELTFGVYLQVFPSLYFTLN